MHLLDSSTLQTVGYAFIGGLMPALVWLYFLLKEDYRHPEPRSILFLAFIAGMIAVPVAVPLEALLRDYLYTTLPTCSPYLPLCLPIIASWAVVEEVLKYGLCAAFVLWRKDVDEPIDLVIYMLTTALGFAALENALFLIEPLTAHNFLSALATDNLRFVGSTLLHVIASSIIGFALALAHSLPRAARAFISSCGLILAISLHTTFNFLIIPRGDTHSILTAFLFVWSGAVIFFGLFEVLKYFEYRAPETPYTF
jgi:RsiW-degrading membrane proteinase PrsW (M82 family)